MNRVTEKLLRVHNFRKVVMAEEGGVLVGWVGDKVTDVGKICILRNLYTLTKSLDILCHCFPLLRMLFLSPCASLFGECPIKPIKMTNCLHRNSFNKYLLEHYMLCTVLSAWDALAKILLYQGLIHPYIYIYFFIQQGVSDD